MAKTNTQRFEDALWSLRILAGKDMAFFKGYSGVLEWLARDGGNPRADKERIGAQLSLGGRGLTRFNSVTNYRKVLRAYLLVKIIRYGMNPTDVAAAKTGMPGHSKADAERLKLENELKGLCSRIIVHHGGITIASEVYEAAQMRNFGNIAQVLRSGRDKGRKILQEAYKYLSAKDTEGYFLRWFGAGNPLLTKAKIKHMLEAYSNRNIVITTAKAGMSGLRSAYGTATPRFMEGVDVFDKQNAVEINVGEHFFSSTGAHSAQIVHDRTLYTRVVEQHMAYKRMMASESSEYFKSIKALDFNDDTYEADVDRLRIAHERESDRIQQLIDRNLQDLPPKDRAEQISVTGVILHEVSHNVLNTTDIEKDGVTMYGPNLCMWLAAKHPDDAARNADSFRLFCEEFLT